MGVNVTPSRTKSILVVAVIVIMVALVAAVELSSTTRIVQGHLSATTTIFISVSCTTSSAEVLGNATTIFVRSYVGNLTVVTAISGFSTNATQICR